MIADLNDMVIFAKVAQLQGISPAARVLDIPKSRVSRRMAALENELGVRLLERSTRAMNLTELGKIYYEHCQRIAEEAASATRSLNHMLDSPRGKLRISASVGTGQKLIAPHLAEFIRLYPDIQLDVRLDNRRVDMIAEGYDLIVRVGVGKLQDSSLISKRIATSRAKIYASPEYLGNSPPITKLEDLHQHRIMTMKDSSYMNDWQLEDVEGNQHVLPIKVSAGLNDMQMLRRVAVDGGGIILIPTYIAKESVQRGQLVNVLPQWSGPEFSFYAVYPSRQGLTPKVRVWIDFFTERLGQL
jgi:DNA-binding transcriptional LysR family regulator